MRKRFLRIFLGLLFVITLLFITTLAVLYAKQDAIVSEFVAKANEDFSGELEIEGSHISPFANFPYISIDLDHVRVWEDKTKSTEALVDIEDVYLGFDLYSILRGEVQIKSLKLSNGFIKLVQHRDGSFNIANALSPKKKIESTEEEFHLDIQRITLGKIDLLKINEENNVLIEAFIDDAVSRFTTSPKHLLVALDSRFEMNVVAGGDTTFVKHKHFDVHTQLDLDQTTQVLTIKPSDLTLERAQFTFDGTVDLAHDLDLNVNVHGSKPNFDLFLAFAPEDLAPVLGRYDNAGRIFFEASVKGKAINGHNPTVTADFGCEDAFFNNKLSNARLDQLYFKGHFTTGDSGKAETSRFSLFDFSARPEAGKFTGNLQVSNFASPEIEMSLLSEFQLEFLAKFLNLDDLQDLKGSVALTMNFHDIVDLAHPERSVEKLNESYFTKLEVSNLSFRTPSFHLPISNLNIKATMDGHEASIERFSLKIGDSDIDIKAKVSDLPAILHHTNDPVTVDMDLKSSLIDIRQLTAGDSASTKPVDEQVRNLRMKLKFNSSAKSFTESPNLPVGEFFIEDLYARLTHYPHELHDFHADVFIDEADFRVVDFTGMIDKSDFHFNGRLKNYDLWFLVQPKGETRVEFNLNSKLLQLEDVFAYGGENYVPEDYRHEEFRDLKIHGFADLHFDKGLRSSDMTFDKVEASMKVHPLRFEKFQGRVHYEDDHLMVQGFGGKLGKSEFTADLHYYLGPDSIVRKRDNRFSLRAPHLDFDELFSYNPPPADSSIDHEAGFNIYTVPFSDMSFDFDIKHLNYHRYLIDNFFAKARTTRNHFVFVDTLSLNAADGALHLNGYFNGSNPSRIYFSPKMGFKGIDLDKLLFKFENFGQDHLVSENLHGKISGSLTGKIHMHADMVPIIDDSEMHIDMEVLEGRLDNYAALHAMADYFRDKNLDRVRFDTLRNKFDLSQGVLTIPAMTINSTLGFIELSGKQDMKMNMEYFVRIPVKLVTQAAMQKLFGKKQDTSRQEDEIQYRDQNRNYSFVNLRIKGTPEKFDISLDKAD